VSHRQAADGGADGGRSRSEAPSGAGTTALGRAVADAGGVLVIDGGLGSRLEERGYDLTGDAWSARLLRDDPQAIAEVHREYLAAGARVATAASYQASYEGFARLGLSAAEAERLMTRSVALAVGARAETPGALVAASVGPYGAMLADGSEYRGDYGLSAARLRAWHARRFEVLAAAGADLLAFETVPCLAEVEALAGLADASGVEAWLSVTISDGRLRSGEPLAEALAVAADSAGIAAVGVNCCDPGEVLDAVHLARSITDLPVVVYPNGGGAWDARRKVWEGGAAFDPGLVGRWVEAGASIVGGCCRVGPPGIAAIAAAVG
jgi:homocysteine S-methyltransferase